MSDAVVPVSTDRVEEAAARLFALLPAHLRDTDARDIGTLEALFRVLGQGSAEVDAALDALGDAPFVETAPVAALPALADLVAVPVLAPLPPEAGWTPRALIADMIRIRRGKGTARVLAELGRDVTGEAALAVEYFQRLSRLAHLIDIRPERPALARITAGVTAQLTGGGFDRSPRLANLRSIARAAGKHHVPHVGLHFAAPVVPVYPAPDLSDLAGGAIPSDRLAGCPALRAWPIAGVAHPGYWQLAARPGGVVRLANPDRTEDAAGESLPESLMPDRLRRLPLHLETEELRKAALEARPPVLAAPPWFDALGQPFTLYLRRDGQAGFTRMKPEEVLICNLDADPPDPTLRTSASRKHAWMIAGTPAPQARSGTSAILAGFDPVTGRAILPAPGLGQTEVMEVRLSHAYAVARPMGAGAQERNDASVPFDLRDAPPGLQHLIRVVDAVAGTSGGAADRVRVVADLATALADWLAHGVGRKGIVVLARCDRQAGATVEVALHPGTELHIVAGQFRVPKPVPGLAPDPLRLGYLVRRERSFVLEAPLVVKPAAAPAAGQSAGVLVLDGLAVMGGVTVKADALSRLWLRHCTLRRPGAAALTAEAGLNGAELALSDCLCGPLALDPPAGQAAVGQLTVARSILVRDGAAAPVVQAESLAASIEDATIFGTVSVKSIEATNVLFTEVLTARQRQEGCLRYSFVAPGSAAPRRFRCQPDLAQAAAAATKGASLTPGEAATVALTVRPVFLDTDFEEPTLAMLHQLCPAAIRSGGEGDTEMGAFAAAGRPIRRANLQSLFDEFLPFGLEAALLDDLVSSAVQSHRSRP